MLTSFTTKQRPILMTLFTLLLLSTVFSGCDRGKEDLVMESLFTEGEIQIQVKTLSFASVQVVQLKIIETHGIKGAVSSALINEKNVIRDKKPLDAIHYQHTQKNSLQLLLFNNTGQVIATATVKAEDFSGPVALMAPKDELQTIYTRSQEIHQNQEEQAIQAIGIVPLDSAEEEVPLLTVSSSEYGLFIMNDVAYDFLLAFDQKEHFNQLFGMKLEESNFDLAQLHLYLQNPDDSEFIDAKTGSAIEQDESIEILQAVQEYYYDESDFPYASISMEGESINGIYQYQVTVHSTSIEGGDFFAVMDLHQVAPIGETLTGSTAEENLFLYILDDFIVEFEDAQLEQLIRETIQQPEAPLYLSQLLEITQLQGGERGIVSLEGLQYLKNLTELQLYNNQITELTPLQNLHSLENLYLHNNQITELSPLQELTNLKWLEITNNSITHITPLQNMLQLEHLLFRNNQVEDLSALQDLLYLTTLDFIFNNVQDLSPLQNLVHLEILWFEENQINDLSPLQALVNLEWLNFKNNQVTDISPLYPLTNLQRLSFDNNQVTDISILQNLVGLEHLHFQYNEVTDISALVLNEGLGMGCTIDMRYNYLDLSVGSQNMLDIITLLEREVIVLYDPQQEQEPSGIQ